MIIPFLLDVPKLELRFYFYFWLYLCKLCVDDVCDLFKLSCLIYIYILLNVNVPLFFFKVIFMLILVSSYQELVLDICCW